MTIKTLTRTEYEAKVRHGYAGTAMQLLPETRDGFRLNTDWDGGHWAVWQADNGATTLGPVNVVTENKRCGICEYIGTDIESHRKGYHP